MCVYVCVWEWKPCAADTIRAFVPSVCLQCCLLTLHNSSREGQSSDGESGWRRRIERKRDCEWYQWNLFVCTLLSRLRPLVRWCHVLMSLWSEVTGLWRLGLFFFYWVSPTTLHYITFTQCGANDTIQYSCVIIGSWLKLCQKRKTYFFISGISYSLFSCCFVFHCHRSGSGKCSLQSFCL